MPEGNSLKESLKNEEQSWSSEFVAHVMVQYETPTYAGVQIRRTNFITFNCLYDLLKNLCQT